MNGAMLWEEDQDDSVPPQMPVCEPKAPQSWHHHQVVLTVQPPGGCRACRSFRAKGASLEWERRKGSRRGSTRSPLSLYWSLETDGKVGSWGEVLHGRGAISPNTHSTATLKSTSKLGQRKLVNPAFPNPFWVPLSSPHSSSGKTSQTSTQPECFLCVCPAPVPTPSVSLCPGCALSPPSNRSPRRWAKATTLQRFLRASPLQVQSVETEASSSWALLCPGAVPASETVPLSPPDSDCSTGVHSLSSMLLALALNLDPLSSPAPSSHQHYSSSPVSERSNLNHAHCSLGCVSSYLPGSVGV